MCLSFLSHNMEFATYLNFLSIRQLLDMYFRGLFPNRDVLRLVTNYITKKMVREGAELTQEERSIYEGLKLSLMHGRILLT